MKLFKVKNLLLGGAMALSTMVASAQYRDHDYYRYQNNFYNTGRHAGWMDSAVNETMNDLNRVSSYGDFRVRRMAEAAQRDLRQFRSSFDRNELDQAINRVERVMNHPIDPRDRNQLASDLHRLREMRQNSWR